MIKEIYAVKSGGRRGIFKKEKFFELINNYPILRYHSFAYRSELEEEPGDVPGSLRHAIRKAAEYLRDLVYLGESADFLEDVSWVEDGFLPFGNESEAENPEILPDKGEDDEEDIEDIDEEYDDWSADNRKTLNAPIGSWEMEYRKIARDIDEGYEGYHDWSAGNRNAFDAPMGSWEMEYRKVAEDIDEGYDDWSADNRNALDAPAGSWEIEYWKIAEDMKECIELIRHGGSDTEKKNAAANLKRHLERCIDDANLSDLTAGYKGLRERNAIGYDPPAVFKFVTQMLRRYPKP